MKISDLIGKDVVDGEGKSVGTVNDVDINTSNGHINKVDIVLEQALFPHKEEIVNFDQINDISYEVLLDKVIDVG
ncbi:PRC-barrel domain protein [Methanobrevibacter cuticularis]|uniref:PRC-barrel domain protein n=1 Tax=Methanobrevibacter cuticularis TaxID=47311 RepID=A0A166E4K5_9EURY|nr:PRC-barrel domain-containing protein [Methanobrevibacter cuticularis]KZX16272.1 PRC-barrel domain protein [Methanobrevibacter cuticularis]